MMGSIPEGITNHDVLEAVDDFDAGIEHPFLESTTYDVVVDGKRYPPKAIVGLAARRLAGRTLSPSDFRGGEGTRCFQVLRDLGYDVVPKVGTESSSGFVTLRTEEELPEKYAEGAVRLVSVNVYERNRIAREACIRHYRHTCAVCGFTFATVYGELGEGFIHIHHLKELASIGHEYEVDPIADLRPVCPNCHAMLHAMTPAMSIAALQAVIADARREASCE